jgi:uncharacterized protein YndB with AHSA1/START domain
MTDRTDAIEAGAGRITLERTLAARIEDVWELWTTPAGIESWWGPGGFRVDVRALDLRPGGQLHYAMTAVGAGQVEFMRRAGMSLTTELRITYTTVEAPRRLEYVHLADFVPGMEPYDVATTLELHEADGGTRLVLTFDPMHDDEWTERARTGWASELGKLAGVLAVRAQGGSRRTGAAPGGFA